MLNKTEPALDGLVDLCRGGTKRVAASIVTQLVARIDFEKSRADRAEELLMHEGQHSCEIGKVSADCEIMRKALMEIDEEQDSDSCNPECYKGTDPNLLAEFLAANTRIARVALAKVGGRG